MNFWTTTADSSFPYLEFFVMFAAILIPAAIILLVWVLFFKNKKRRKRKRHHDFREMNPNAGRSGQMPTRKQEDFTDQPKP
jgi:uncharacterized paraquat-inducible protein A